MGKETNGLMTVTTPSIFVDLQDRVGYLWQGGTDLLQRDGAPAQSDKSLIIHNLYTRLMDMQRGPFAGLGIVLPASSQGKGSNNESDKDKVYEEIRPRVENEDNAPKALFHTLFVRTVEHCVEIQNPKEKTVTDSVNIYENGIVQIRSPQGFYVIYSPSGERSMENLVMIVYLAKDNGSDAQEYDDAAIYIYNPNVPIDDRLSAYKVRRTKNKDDCDTVYEDKPLYEWAATNVLRGLRDRMDKRPGTLSSSQTILR